MIRIAITERTARMQSYKGIPPIIRSRLLQPLLLLLIISITCSILLIDSLAYGKSVSDYNNIFKPRKHVERRPIYFSEFKLRSMIEASNGQLRQLKRDFVKSITSVYFNMKLDNEIGIESAKRGETAAIASILMAEEFANIVIRKHIIQRRVTSGLKVAFLRFLSIDTLKLLTEHFKSYKWLDYNTKVDLRERFPNAKETQYVQLYNLIKLRANARAADDILVLTSDSMKRILKIVQWFLFEQKRGGNKDLDASQLILMQNHVKKILTYYMDEVIGYQKEQQEDFDRQLIPASRLAKLVGGEREFMREIDKIIDEECLDIDLSWDAENLDLPPTINENMIKNIERKWIPNRVLESMNEDREVLLRYKRDIGSFISLESELDDVDLGGWCSNSLLKLKNSLINFFSN